MLVNLLNYSYFTLLNSTMSIDDIIDYAIKNNQKYVCLTDFNNMYGAIEFYTKAIKNNLIPIIGLNIVYKNINIFLIAKDNVGYKSLIKISSFVMTNKPFELNDYINGLIFITEDIKDLAYINIKNIECYSLNQNKDNPIAARLCLFQKKEDILIFKSLLAIKNDVLLNEYKNDNRYENNYCLSSEEIKNYYSQESIRNLENVLNNCKWKIEFSHKNCMPKFASGKDSRILLQTLCVNSLRKLFGNDNSIPNQYILRLKNELSTIDKMGFNDYFLIVQDYIQFAKQNGILVGPGRGSAAGSLVSYLLNITTIDPIKNNLIFERFLNVERVAMPDIDVDFMDDRRNEIIEYLINKYGPNHVANIVIFQRIKAKMAIRDVGRILNMNKTIINSICKLIDDEFIYGENETYNKKINDYIEEYKQLFDIAKRINNFPRQIGLHAAGIVLSNENLYEIIPIQTANTNNICTQFSMEYLEIFGLNKIDILGLVNLTILNQCIQLIEKNHSKKIDLYNLPINDCNIYDDISKGKTLGIFQLESAGMTNLITKVKPKNIEDISICSALFRPGPQKNINMYLTNRNGPENIKYLNDEIKTILQYTCNVIIYQEQVIQIVQKIANFSLAKADLFRRAISKKNEKELLNLKKNFINGGISNGYDKEIVEKIFDYIFEFANYGFNHSHSLAYSYISYWMAYLAHYYPIEFYLTLLSNTSVADDKFTAYINELKNNGCDICHPDINLSFNSFRIYDKKLIIIGFSTIKGIGNTTCEDLLKIREKMPNKRFTNLLSCIKSLKNNGIGLSTINLLIKSGSFDKLNENHDRFWLINNINEIFKNVDNITNEGKLITHIEINNNKPNKTDLDKIAHDEYELLNIYLGEYEIAKIRKELNKFEPMILSLQEIDNDKKGKYFHTIAYVSRLKEFKDKKNNLMAFITLQDETKTFRCVAFSFSYTKFADIIKENEMYLFSVKKDIKQPSSLVILKAEKLNKS